MSDVRLIASHQHDCVGVAQPGPKEPDAVCLGGQLPRPRSAAELVDLTHRRSFGVSNFSRKSLCKVGEFDAANCDA
jgi:hypothetical protein